MAFADKGSTGIETPRTPLAPARDLLLWKLMSSEISHRDAEATLAAAQLQVSGGAALTD